MQASLDWTPPGGTLGRLCGEARKRAESLASARQSLEQRASRAPAGVPFEDALRRQDVAVIAEIKRRSPSKGDINPGIDAADQARSYVAGGAAALSVLTEPTSFGGDDADLDRARVASLPMLRKDFLLDPLQLVEARALGASAALLIVRALSPNVLPEMIRVGHDLGLDLLVEIRDRLELDRALSAGARIIGVNNRDLETLEIDPSNAERIIPHIPAELVAVAESGVSSASDVRYAADAGADAVLVGSSISAASDPALAVKSLTGISRRGR